MQNGLQGHRASLYALLLFLLFLLPECICPVKSARFVNHKWFPLLPCAPRFDIRLMKEGRMKGQAFIGLPNEKAAARALKEANGYVLYEKPMVVVSFYSSICIIFFVISADL